VADLTPAATKLPRGAVPAAWAAIAGAHDDLRTRAVVEEALKGALPVIERAVLRDAARLILLADRVARGLNCPACHGKPATSTYDHNIGRSHYRCGCGREWDVGHMTRVDYSRTIDRSLHRLARGEPLPDLPPKETANAQN
jgi:hypothetical protein